MSWSEFSFILKPSPLGGVGVFAIHDIPVGTQVFSPTVSVKRVLKVKDVPAELLKYCIYINDEECFAPERFDRMEIGWYLNHSATPNSAKKDLLHHDHVNDREKNLFLPLKKSKRVMRF